MIITCEQCSTQFQLDDSRVPAQGVRVRCSRCRHAFFAKPPAPAGEFCWVDLAATDAARATDFYGNLFGWGASPQRANGGTFVRLTHRLARRPRGRKLWYLAATAR